MRTSRPVFKRTAVALLVLGAGVVHADSFSDALSQGKANLDLRYRYESVDQDNALKSATANTVRTRLGYTTGNWNGFFIAADFEHIATLGDDDYNSRTNGNTLYSVIPDPEGSELNQSYLGYKLGDSSTFKYGRQRIKLDNDRFIGNSGWRQNEQTFDAFSYNYKGSQGLNVTGAWIYNVNRIFGEEGSGTFAGDHGMSSQIINVNYKFITAYGYFLDYDEAFKANSASTIGARYNDSFKLSDSVSLLAVAEFARQSDYGDNTASFDHDYHMLEFGVKTPYVTVKLSHESLGADDIGSGSSTVLHAFQTPLATLHAFNGWADMFLTTPGSGLVDTFVTANGTVGDFGWMVRYDNYDADIGSANYGSELGAQATYAFGKPYTIGLKLARYSADDFAVDTDKLWVFGEYRF